MRRWRETTWHERTWGEMRHTTPCSNWASMKPTLWRFGVLPLCLPPAKQDIVRRDWWSLFFPKPPPTLSLHFIPLPKKLQTFGQEIKSDSAQASRTSHLFTTNTGTEEQVQRHHKDTISRIQNVGNLIRQMNSKNKRKEKERVEIYEQRDWKSINKI